MSPLSIFEKTEKNKFIFTKLNTDLVPIKSAKFVDDVSCSFDIKFKKYSKALYNLIWRNIIW